MIWAACLVRDAVTLQELLELFGIVAWTVVTLDYIGKPNSVTIIDNSVHTAAEVELGNFLTRMYLERHLQLLGSPFFSSRTNLLPMCAMEMGVALG